MTFLVLLISGWLLIGGLYRWYQGRLYREEMPRPRSGPIWVIEKWYRLHSKIGKDFVAEHSKVNQVIPWAMVRYCGFDLQHPVMNDFILISSAAAMKIKKSKIINTERKLYSKPPVCRYCSSMFHLLVVVDMSIYSELMSMIPRLASSEFLKQSSIGER